MNLPAEAQDLVCELLQAIPRMSEERKVLAVALEGLAALFGCDRGAVYLYKRSRARLYKVRSLCEGEEWDHHTLIKFFRMQRPELPASVIMAPIRAGRPVIGVLALARPEPFEEGAGKVATRVLKLVGGMMGMRREIRVLEAECRIARAYLAGADPMDVIYKVLHELRRMIDYDHGATVIVRTAEGLGRIVARQIAWTKGKGGLVGHLLPFAWEELQDEHTLIVGAEPAAGNGGRLLKEASELSEAGSPPKSSLMVSPIRAGVSLLGCIELASSQPSFFTEADAQVLERFVPWATKCMMDLRGA